MSSALLAALALASLPAANPLSLPEGLVSSTAAVPPPPTAVMLSAVPPLAPPTAPAAAPLSNLASSSPSPWGLAGGGLVILGLCAATLWMQRRKRQGPRHIQVVETASLGAKRSLALVVVGRQSMLLSCCDSGIFLVSTQPATPEMLRGETPATEPDAGGDSPILLHPAGTSPSPRMGPAGGFATQLAEAEETQGLRRRLSEAGVLR